MSCDEYAGGLTICGPSATVVLAVESAGVRWCFVCRKRVEFTDTLTHDAEPSWYDPNWTRRCEHGHYGGDLFPGTDYL